MSPWFDYPQPQWREKHVVVVGAGIAGCQISWHLSQLGWRVTLLERESQISSQASGNLAGIISPLMSAKPSKTEQFYLQAFEYTTQQLRQMIATGSEIDWFDCGVLQLAHSERELQRWHALKNRGLSPRLIELLSQQQASEVAGIPCQYPASYFPQAGYINPASWCQALITASQCELITSTDVAALVLGEDKRWSVEDNSGASLASAEVVVLSNGQDINLFSQSDSLPLTHILGQTTLAESNSKSSDLKCAINHEGYVTPAYKNTYVFGATFDREFEKVEADEQSDRRNMEQLSKHLPQLASGFEEAHTGHASVRSTTPDRLPYVGGVYDQEYYIEEYVSLKNGSLGRDYPAAEYLDGLYILGGLGSRGLTSSGLCAKVLSALINNSLPADSLHLIKTLHPARFMVRQLKKGQHA